MVPKDCTFTKEHEWVYVEEGMAVIGISDYASGELGDIVYVELPEPGTNVKQMDPIGTIEAVKTVADIFSPVSGEVTEVNEKVIDSPEVINSDPYGEGWFVKVKMEDPVELDALFSYEEYQEFLGEQEPEDSEENDDEEE